MPSNVSHIDTKVGLPWGWWKIRKTVLTLRFLRCLLLQKTSSNCALQLLQMLWVNNKTPKIFQNMSTLFQLNRKKSNKILIKRTKKKFFAKFLRKP